jgi:hypothetical protein
MAAWEHQDAGQVALLVCRHPVFAGRGGERGQHCCCRSQQRERGGGGLEYWVSSRFARAGELMRWIPPAPALAAADCGPRCRNKMRR